MEPLGYCIPERVARQYFQPILGESGGGTDRLCGRSRCSVLLTKCQLAKTIKMGAQVLSRCLFSVSCQESEENVST